MLPVVFSWAWNLQGGFLRNLGFFDRGGSVVIFQTGALAGIIGSIVLGPRYGKFMKKAEELKLVTGGKDVERKTLAAQLDEALEDIIDVDDLFL